MIKKLLRLVMTTIGVAIGYGVFLLVRFLINLEGVPIRTLTDTEEFWMSVIFELIFAILFFKLTPILSKQSRKAAINIEMELKGVSSSDMITGTVGLIAGFIIAFLLTQLYELFQITWLSVSLTIVTYIVLGYLGIVIATRKGSDLINAINAAKKTQFVGGKGKAKGAEATPKIFDTSVIIDGRISDIMRTGFIEGRIIIPEFVLVELRHIADSSDSLKRQRGRRGLDILNKIQIDYGIEIYNTAEEKSLEEIPGVDVKLLKLAQIMNGKVVTNDFNLNKVAAIKGVEVLNINELANTLKPVVLPGEMMQLFLVKEGKEQNQAVAYLDDGTMIVVEDGRRFIGQTIETTVTSVLQTSAGRMIFAKPKMKK